MTTWVVCFTCLRVFLGIEGRGGFSHSKVSRSMMGRGRVSQDALF